MRWMVFALGLTMAVGCFESRFEDDPDGSFFRPEPDGAPVPDGAPNPEPDGSSPPGGEVPPPPPEPTGCNDNATGETVVYELDVLEFASPDAATGHVPGFPLDGFVTGAGDPTGCGQADWTYDVDGDGTIQTWERGVDNQLASLAPTLESFLDPQDAIAGGRLVIRIELSGVNDLRDDSCVDLAVTIQASGVEAGQTEVQAVTKDGRLLVGPVSFPLRFEVGGALVDLPVTEAMLAFDVATGTLEHGLIGGSLNIDELVDAVLPALGGTVEENTLRGILEPVADMQPDAEGRCQAVSLGLEFRATAL